MKNYEKSRKKKEMVCELGINFNVMNKIKYSLLNNYFSLKNRNKIQIRTN